MLLSMNARVAEILNVWSVGLLNDQLNKKQAATFMLARNDDCGVWRSSITTVKLFG